MAETEPKDRAFFFALEFARTGNQEGSRLLVRLIEPRLLAAVRKGLVRTGLNHSLDEQDVCQDVLTRFFQKLTEGEFQFENREDFFRLLLSMARQRILDELRKHRALRRDRRRLETLPTDSAIYRLPGNVSTPSAIVGKQEVMDELSRRLTQLTEDEREVISGRSMGRSWAELAAERGDNADALRKRIERAVDRIAQGLKIPDE